MIRNMLLRWLALAATLAAVAVLAGCATAANRDNMAGAPLQSAKKLPYSVSVDARGGSGTGAMDSSNIANADLKAALESSITKSSLFKSVVQGRNGDYELTVTINQLQKPMFGGAFTVTLETGWSLVRTRDQQVVMRKAVRSEHTATMGDSLVGATRLRLAVEGAVRKNISDGLQSIADLPI
jgi:ABC-type uncharacterized transport system auxiliary subunit